MTSSGTVLSYQNFVCWCLILISSATFVATSGCSNSFVVGIVVLVLLDWSFWDGLYPYLYHPSLHSLAVTWWFWQWTQPCCKIPFLGKTVYSCTCGSRTVVHCPRWQFRGCHTITQVCFCLCYYCGTKGTWQLIKFLVATKLVNGY